MVQEFHVLRCFSCKTFQVHQVKKDKRWRCKLCGEKQSIIKVYGEGTGADCRHHVQKLNMMQGDKQTGADLAAWSTDGQQLSDGARSEEDSLQQVALYWMDVLMLS
ncbi:MRN complex-interacting protein [Protopterus annectens]|uniref:MRN complex-interacting protein n=1 Tax=Protopterus annectens TaxID=7888 RepID=UPI001CFC435E|nr:MRN complex-interacting protein [Protopterus annectens]